MSGAFEFTVTASNGVDPAAVLPASITITEAPHVVSLSVERAQLLADEVQTVYSLELTPSVRYSSPQTR